MINWLFFHVVTNDIFNGTEFHLILKNHIKIIILCFSRKKISWYRISLNLKNRYKSIILLRSSKVHISWYKISFNKKRNPNKLILSLCSSEMHIKLQSLLLFFWLLSERKIKLKCIIQYIQEISVHTREKIWRNFLQNHIGLKQNY